MNAQQNLAIYIHWPFCKNKCPYCDFNSHVRDGVDHAAWRESLLRELDHYAALLPERRITSLFFGGGTPSLMEPATVAALIERVNRHWAVDDNVEITLEANPTSVEAEKFAALKASGVNRVSLGVQSFDDAALKFLGREHSATQARHAIEAAARYFPRYSFDLIYARAGQSAAAWEQELRTALPLTRGHMSLYQLTIEAATAFYTRAARGEVLTATPDLAADMFIITREIMREAGLPDYEVSNHAAPGQESRHNLIYWHYDDFIGVGPGAHGRYVGADGKRQASIARKAPEAWLGQVAQDGHGVQTLSEVDHATAQQEALMMGLRLSDGIERTSWKKKFGGDIADFLPGPKLARLQEEGLLRLNEKSLTASPEGMVRLNGVLRHLLNA